MKKITRDRYIQLLAFRLFASGGRDGGTFPVSEVLEARTLLSRMGLKYVSPKAMKAGLVRR